MMDAAMIRSAAQALLDAAPGSRVILFGSYARGEAKPGSDLDFLVVEPNVTARRSEMVRLSDTLRRLGIHADVLVVSEENFQEWSSIPGTVLYEAAHGGEVYGAAT